MKYIFCMAKKKKKKIRSLILNHENASCICLALNEVQGSYLSGDFS